jgi:phenylalanyl-tRNA synthetase beta chain
VLAKVRHVLSAAGVDEALTLSVVSEEVGETVSPWTRAEPLKTLTPVIRGAHCLRRSLLPSLLATRRLNETLANPEIELYEIARVYLPRGGELPDEQQMLGMTSGRDFLAVKGLIETVVAEVNPSVELLAADADCDPLDPAASCRLLLDGELLGFVGELTPDGLSRFELRGPSTVAEIRLAPLNAAARLVPKYEPLPSYPAVTRDLNFVVDESVCWSDLAATVRRQSGSYFEDLAYKDTYRDEKRLGRGKKSLLMTLTLRWREGTLTNQQADAIRDQIVAACRQHHNAELRA